MIAVPANERQAQSVDHVYFGVEEFTDAVESDALPESFAVRIFDGSISRVLDVAEKNDYGFRYIMSDGSEVGFEAKDGEYTEEVASWL